MTNDVLAVHVVYENPSDYPGKVVVRVQHAQRDGSVRSEGFVNVFDTLDEARTFLMRNPNLTRFDRFPGDDPVIAEWWM